MSHECDECGETFETLSRLRLHDCTKPADGMTDLQGAWELSTLSDDRDASVPELDDAIENASEDIEATYQMLGVFENALTTALRDNDDGGETFRDVYWSYYEPTIIALDKAVQRGGWKLVVRVADAYDPATDEEVPLIAPVIENVIGRNLIRTRLQDGVGEIPAEPLAYLETVTKHADDGDDTAREEAYTYGWGIGHPDHPVADRLQDGASEYPFWAHSAVEQAFYADQHAAVDLLGRIVTEETLAESVHIPGGDLARYMFDAVAGPDSDEFWPTVPRYWDWHEELNYAFEWDDEVKERIRDLAEETGVAADFADDWTFQDLMV